MGLKTALIAGGDTPIASILARALRGRGFQVVCMAQDDVLVDAASTIEAAARALGGAIGVLVTVPAHYLADEPTALTREILSRHVEANAHAHIMLTQAFVAQLPENARDGLVINVVSGEAVSLPATGASFVLAQSTLLAYTKIAAQAFAPWVRVNALLPPPDCFEADSVPNAVAQDIDRTLGLLLDVKTITGEAMVVDNTKVDAWRTPE